MNVSVCPATLEDVGKIANVVSTSVTSLFTEDYTTEQIGFIIDYYDADFYLEVIESNSRNFLVAKVAGKIVGFGSISEDGRAVADLFVLPDYIRQGIGTLLLENLEQIAIEKQAPRLWVMASYTAQPFYASCGFKYEKDTALIDSETGMRIPLVDMVKILARKSSFKGDNPAYYGNLSTLTVSQFIRLATKILLGSSK